MEKGVANAHFAYSTLPYCIDESIHKKGKLESDQERIKNSQRFNGFLAIATHAKKLSTIQILD
jgi:hypothetical protein